MPLPQELQPKGHEKAISDKQLAIIDRDPANSLDLPKFGDYETVAELNIGNGVTATDFYDTSTVFLLHSGDGEKPNDDLKSLQTRAAQAHLQPSEYLLAAVNKGGNIDAMAFVPTSTMAQVGREGNIKWFDFGVEQPKPEGWTPFDGNLSVSRKQFSVAVSGKHVHLHGNKKSYTGLKAANVNILDSSLKYDASPEKVGEQIDTKPTQEAEAASKGLKAFIKKLRTK